ncbi:MAG: hypothetical protein ABIZ49_06120 [Opitutaceae bacterium]
MRPAIPSRIEVTTALELTSGALGRWTAEEAERRGICGLLAKPLTAASVLDAIKRALRNGPSAHGARSFDANAASK